MGVHPDPVDQGCRSAVYDSPANRKLLTDADNIIIERKIRKAKSQPGLDRLLTTVRSKLKDYLKDLDTKGIDPKNKGRILNYYLMDRVHMDTGICLRILATALERDLIIDSNFRDLVFRITFEVNQKIKQEAA